MFKIDKQRPTRDLLDHMMPMMTTMTMMTKPTIRRF